MKRREESETEEVEDTAHSDTTEDTMAHKNVCLRARYHREAPHPTSPRSRFIETLAPAAPLKQAIHTPTPTASASTLPEAKDLWNQPEFIKRKTDWVNPVAKCC